MQIIYAEFITMIRKGPDSCYSTLKSHTISASENTIMHSAQEPENKHYANELVVYTNVTMINVTPSINLSR